MKRQDILENQAKIVFLGIGSNLGLRKRNIEKAKFLLAQHNLNFLSVSSYYETPSWPDPRKPRFLNIVLKLKCYYNPQELLKIYKSIGLKGLSRSEFIIKNEIPYLLEVNTVPGLTKESILPQQVKLAGITLTDLFESLIEEALI